MAQLLEYKCPCCGGVVEFDSATQQMKCPYCDTVFDVAAMADMDSALNQAPTDEMNWDASNAETWQEGEDEHMRVYVCQSCGGEIIAEDVTGAMHCPYCDNPIVMTGSFAGDLKPEYVIPFKLDKEAAKKALLEHMSGKKLLPKLFKDENHLDEIKGIYIPFWLFDADAEANMGYRATRVRVWNDARFTYEETQYYRVLRSGTIGFDHIPVDASTKMPDDLMDSLEPYDFSEAVDFQTAYLSGYLADRYDVTAEDSMERANTRIKSSASSAIARTVQGYATVTPQENNIRLVNGKSHYTLLPVWLLNTTWEGKKYTFAMNGQTGKFIGDMPVDQKAAWKYRLLYGAGIGAVIYLIATLFAGM